jgi:hypothetical protein
MWSCLFLAFTPNSFLLVLFLAILAATLKDKLFFKEDKIVVTMTMTMITAATMIMQEQKAKGLVMKIKKDNIVHIRKA